LLKHVPWKLGQEDKDVIEISHCSY
jgi:hypothetical protein